MEGTYEYMWIIIGSILLVALIKVIYQIYKNKVGERSTYRPIQTSTPNSNCQISTGIREFGPVNYYANARHNKKDRWFQFMYREVNGEWLAYILRMPSLNGRDGDLHLTHRYKNENIYWICYDPQPRSLEGIQSVSRAWADRELEYISTGVPFEEQHW